jgi:hypothetical protein
MPTDSESDFQLEIGHVLLIDIVGYSKLLITEQREQLQALNEVDIAQRVMDRGDAGHVLLSKHVADDLAPHPRLNRCLHSLGECEVKHGVHVSIVNFYDDQFGNATTPLIISAKPALELGLRLSRGFLASKQSSLLTRIAATESVSLCVRMKS